MLTSNAITGEQVPGPLELRLEQIGPVKVGVPLDPSDVFRVVLHNRSERDVTFYTPGDIGVLGFSIYKPHLGEVWPKGERPFLGRNPGPSKKTTLGPGKSVELFGTSPAFGKTPGSWSYPAVETFQIRAMFSQPAPGPGIHYSKYITVTSVK